MISSVGMLTFPSEWENKQKFQNTNQYMGLSENRVYSQWNSNLIGIMIINQWVYGYTIFRHTHINDTHTTNMGGYHFFLWKPKSYCWVNCWVYLELYSHCIPMTSQVFPHAFLGLIPIAYPLVIKRGWPVKSTTCFDDFTAIKLQS